MLERGGEERFVKKVKQNSNKFTESDSNTAILSNESDVVYYY